MSDTWYQSIEKEVITDYKVSTEFRRGRERSEVISYQFKYQIALAYLKVRYPRLELEENLFIDYPKDQNVLIAPKIPFDNSLDSLPRPNT